MIQILDIVYFIRYFCITSKIENFAQDIDLFETKFKPMSRSVTVLKTTSSLKDEIGRHSFVLFDGDWNSILTWDRAHRARSNHWSWLTSVGMEISRRQSKGNVVKIVKVML